MTVIAAAMTILQSRVVPEMQVTAEMTRQCNG
jgi:hypothetical protein